jgi:hypothetical protein
LLHHPVAGRVCGRLEVENASTAVFDREEAVEHAEAERGHG